MTMAKDTRPPSERVNDTALVRESLALSIEDALARHKQAGKPVAVWRDGQVAWIPPEEIPDRVERE